MDRIFGNAFRNRSAAPTRSSASSAGAIANLERYLCVTSDARINADTWMLAPAHKRLGELYEAKGDAKRAAEHYATFVELWKRADPDLQPKVTEVRARLERVRKMLRS